MRILLASDSPFSVSAYASQALMLAKALNSAGHTVIYYGYTYQGVAMIYQGVQVVGNHPFSDTGRMRDLTAYYVEKYECDCVLTMKDAYVLDTGNLARLSVPWLCFSPIDTEPASAMLIQSVQHATRVITPTRFSVEQYAQQGIKADYAPHAVDTDFFTPGDRAAFRKEHGISEDAFLAVMVAANVDYPSRKPLDQSLIAWLAMAQNEPLLDAVLWLHTDMLGLRGGVNLENILLTMNAPERIYRYTEQAQYHAGCTPEFMRDLYREADVLLAPSEGEGFCVPVIEAAACGTPAIVTDFTAFREVHRTGWRIPTNRPESGETYWSPIGGLRFKPTRGAIVRALKIARQADPQLRTDARQSSLRYNLTNVMSDFWLSLMAEIEAQVMEAVLA